MSLIANTAPVAYGALGTPIQGLANVTGLDPFLLGAMVGRQLPFFSLIVPFWLIWTFAGWRGMRQVWPAILVCGVSFAVPQFLISNYVNPWIVDIGASLISMACLIGFLQIWQPKELWLSPKLRTRDDSAVAAEAAPAPAPAATAQPDRAQVWMALLPWIIVCAVLLIWGTDWFKVPVNKWAVWSYAVPDLHNQINKVPPVVTAPTREGAVFSFTWLSYTGTGMLIAAIISGVLMGFSPARLVTAYGRTIKVCAYSLITICGDAGDRHPHAALGHRRDAWPRLRGRGRVLSLLRHAAGLARRRAHGLRHRLQHPVWQSAEDHVASSSACRRS